jgi:hypothetical protein
MSHGILIAGGGSGAGLAKSDAPSNALNEQPYR